MWAAAFALLLTYLLGSFPTGLALSWLVADIDVREHGSGNIGATNVARVVSKKLGAITLAGDLCKGLVPTLLAPLVLPDPRYVGAVAVTAFIGHCWSAFLGFRGGKGVATAAGGLLALAPVPTLLAVATWGAVVGLTRKSSLGALVAAAVLPLACWAWQPDQAPSALAIALGVAWRHEENIRRLRGGAELKV